MKQSFIVPGQLGVLSADTIHFGCVPLYSVVRNLLVLRNLSDTRPIYFKWAVKERGIGMGNRKVLREKNRDRKHAEQDDSNDGITITPISGMIRPNTFIVFRVILKTLANPRILDKTLSCLLTYANIHTTRTTGSQSNSPRSQNNSPKTRGRKVRRSSVISSRPKTVDEEAYNKFMAEKTEKLIKYPLSLSPTARHQFQSSFAKSRLLMSDVGCLCVCLG